MTGPEHSKQPKTVTIDLEPEAIHEMDVDRADEGGGADAEAVLAQSMPPAASRSSGVVGRLGSSIAGGLIALTGAAGLQYTGYLPNVGPNAQLLNLQTEVAKFSSIPRLDPAAIDGLSQAQNDLAAQLSRLSADVAQVKSTVPSSSNKAIAALEGKVAALEAKIAATPMSGAEQGDSTAFQALANKVATLEARAQEPRAAQAVAQAIAASGLKAAIDRGGSFMNELETYASVVPAAPDVEALRSLSAKGVPSREELLAQFGDVANAMIDASNPPDPNMGILQRLTHSAKGLVKARRVGEVEGDAVDAVVARMEVALQRNDMSAVISLADQLPDASKTAGKEFFRNLTARRDTDTLVTRALGAALLQAGSQ